MDSGTPPMQRAVFGLLGVVCAVLLAAGIIGAVKVDGTHTGHLTAGGTQPSVGSQLLPGPSPTSPETSTSTSPLPTAPLTPSPMAATPSAVSAAGAAQDQRTTPPATISRPATPASTTSTTSPGCSASVSDPTPQPGQKETVQVASRLDNTTVSATVHYASGDADYKTKTTASGQAQVSFTVPAKELPGQVGVDVVVGTQEHCQTAFTVV